MLPDVPTVNHIANDFCSIQRGRLSFQHWQKYAKALVNVLKDHMYERVTAENFLKYKIEFLESLYEGQTEELKRLLAVVNGGLDVRIRSAIDLVKEQYASLTESSDLTTLIVLDDRLVGQYKAGTLEYRNFLYTQPRAFFAEIEKASMM